MNIRLDDFFSNKIQKKGDIQSRLRHGNNRSSSPPKRPSMPKRNKKSRTEQDRVSQPSRRKRTSTPERNTKSKTEQDIEPSPRSEPTPQPNEYANEHTHFLWVGIAVLIVVLFGMIYCLLDCMFPESPAVPMLIEKQQPHQIGHHGALSFASKYRRHKGSRFR